MSIFTIVKKAYVSNLLLSAFILMALSVSDVLADDIVKLCETTPAIEPGVEPPEKFGMTNNLRRLPSKHLLANGIPIIVRGVVMDDQCVPLAGAVVKLWHADAEGDYEYRGNPEDFDVNFATSGIAITNNMGQYEFLTVKPGEYAAKPSVFHFQIEHELIEENLSTDVFIGTVDDAKEHHPKISARILEQLLVSSKPMYRYTEQKGEVYNYNFTMNGISQYRGF